jgi:hypothetical protein
MYNIANTDKVVINTLYNLNFEKNKNDKVAWGLGTLETICRNNSLISNKKESIVEVGCYETAILTDLTVRWVNILKLDQNFIVQIIIKRAIFNFI